MQEQPHLVENSKQEFSPVQFKGKGTGMLVGLGTGLVTGLVVVGGAAVAGLVVLPAVIGGAAIAATGVAGAALGEKIEDKLTGDNNKDK